MSTPTPSLTGCWQLQRWSIGYSDGRTPTLPYGEAATGLLLYSADGWMSACIARAGRGHLGSDSVRHAPPAEQLAAFESYFQYAGRYTVHQGKDGLQVVHSVTHSLNPNFVGTEQVRNMAFGVDGSLTLSASDSLTGSVTRLHSLIWSRQGAHA